MDHEDYDYEKIRLIILGEATTLCTFFLTNNQRLTKANYAQLSRLTSMIIESEEEADLNDENLVVDPLIKSLILLKSHLSKEKLTTIEPFHIRPFCDVVVNKDVSGPITGRALQSILKFLTEGFIKDDDMVRLIGESVTKARFVGTDVSSDEVVLMRILSVLENLIVQPFYTLSNSLVCEIMQSCFRIAFEARLTELLRKTAVKSLSLMVKALFGRISHFDDEESSYNLLSSQEQGSSQKLEKQSNASFHKLNRMGKRFNLKGKAQSQAKINKEDLGHPESHNKNYGLACVHELLSYLTSLINPLADGQNTDTMISVGLSLLIIIFETAVQDIGSKFCLLSVVKTDLCWNIMQLLINDKNLNSFSTVLRLAFIVFVNLRQHLKFQFEAFLVKLIEIVVETNPPNSLEIRDICVEHLLLLFRHIPFLPHELFYNYDCDLYASNMLEELLELFSKNCFAQSNNPNTNIAVSGLNFTTLQMLSFEVLLANLSSLQHSEIAKQDCALFPSPATVLVNISHFKDLPTKLDNESGHHLQEQQSTPMIAPIIHHHSMEGGDEHHSVTSNSPEEMNFEMLHHSNGSLNELDSPRAESPPSSPPPPPLLKQDQEPMMNKFCVTYLFPEAQTVPKSSDEIQNIKARKSLLLQATERFNQKPSKGIEFLKENNLTETDDDIVSFLKNNNRLDKKQIGEYLANKKHLAILSQFVSLFPFKDTRIDISLRMFLEAFRLPGEAPLISMVLEQFAHHWHESNGCPFENEDAAFSLAYAIIMLNVDQHNSNAKRQTTPMNPDEFISNLRQVNGGKDFDRQLLTDIYFMIKNNEIIMPAEQTGIIKEKYVWKCLLKNSETLNGVYWHSIATDKCVNKSSSSEVATALQQQHTASRELYTSILNRSLFDIAWGPSISTLTLVLDKISPERHPKLSKRVLEHGFANCSLLCANYGHLDNLVVTLSKFIVSASRFSTKCELVARQLFKITREYANEMRSSWENIIEMMLFWYDHKLLDNGFSVEDFALEGRTLVFTRKLSPRQLRMLQESNANQSNNFLSNFYSYFASSPTEETLSNDIGTTLNKPPISGDGPEEAMKPEVIAEVSPIMPVVKENEYCGALTGIIEESKFLHIDSLIELIRALINVQYWEGEFDDDLEIFKLEILVKVILLNRDRLSIFWDIINKHLVKLMKFCPQSEYLTERVISAIFRLAIRFTPRPDLLNDQIYVLMYQMLLTFDPIMLQKNYTAQALHSFVTHCNCYLSKNEEWALVFNLLLAVGIGFYPANKKFVRDDREDASAEVLQNSAQTNSLPESESASQAAPDTATQSTTSSSIDLRKLINNLNLNNFADSGFQVNYPFRILDVEAYAKCSDVLSLIIREYLPNSAKQSVANEQLNSYEICQMAVGSLCKFVEASIKIQLRQLDIKQQPQSPKVRANANSRLTRLTNAILSSSESDSEDESKPSIADVNPQVQPKLSTATEICSRKLLDLLHYLHIHATEMIGEQVGVNEIWNTIWCPILQAISFFCCDCRRPVRTDAFTFLQRTLQLHDLTRLNAQQWESCFNRIFFPLLAKLLEPINLCDPIGMDDTRMRTTNLLCKVFLQHLSQLHGLVTFTALWITILDFMDRYIRTEMQTDFVREAIPQSLKNILLVMKNAGIFNDTLASLTWDRINVFLPDLYQELAADLQESQGKHLEQTSSLPSQPALMPHQHPQQQQLHQSPQLLPMMNEGQNASVNFTAPSLAQATMIENQVIPLVEVQNSIEQFRISALDGCEQTPSAILLGTDQSEQVTSSTTTTTTTQAGAEAAVDQPTHQQNSEQREQSNEPNVLSAVVENNQIDVGEHGNGANSNVGLQQPQQQQQSPTESIHASHHQEQTLQQQQQQQQQQIDYPLQEVSISNSYIDMNAYYSAYYAAQQQAYQQQQQQQQQQQMHQQQPPSQVVYPQQPTSPQSDVPAPTASSKVPMAYFSGQQVYPGQAFPGTIAQFHAVNSSSSSNNYYYSGNVPPTSGQAAAEYPWPAPSVEQQQHQQQQQPPPQSPQHHVQS